MIDNDETTVEVDNQSFWTELKESANAEISDATTPDPGNALEEFVESARRAAVEEKQDDLKATVHGTIHPFNPTKLKWDVFVGLIVVYAVLVVPWKVGFNVPSTDVWIGKIPSKGRTNPSLILFFG